MNSFYKVVDFLKDSFKTDQFVHTITYGDIEEIDIDKKNIYPLVNLLIVSARQEQGVNVFLAEVHVLDQRNESKKPITDKFLKNDNRLDILNTNYAICNRFITKLRLQHNDYDIEVFGVTAPEAGYADFTNVLDGWKFTIELSIPNNNIEVCS
jgi:hypothetical protein